MKFEISTAKILIMKTYKPYLFIVFYFLCRNTYCDIIPPNSHYVNKCVLITNVNEYPDISLLGVSSCMAFCPAIYVIGPTTCLEKGYKLNCLMIYGVRNSYLAGKDITTIDWSKDKHAFKTNIQIDPSGGYADNSNVIYSIKQYYRIVGFTDSSVVIYKYKEEDYFCNGSIAVSSLGKYSGDSTTLSQSLPAETKVATGRKSLNIFMVSKSRILMDELYADNLTNRSYFVNIIKGEAIETRKIVIE
jgi:hypothetical protein